MIVSEKDEADIRELIKGDARLTYTGRTKPTERADASRPDWVREDIQAGDLEQECCVIHEGDSDVIWGKFLVQLGDSGVDDGFRPLAPFFAEQFEYTGDRGDKSLRESWIAITFPIEVIGGCWQRYGNAQD